MASLLQRLKEREFVQWTLAYLAGVLAFVEATSLPGAHFLWPEAVGRMAPVVALFGFFATLVLAWYHGEKGRQSVSDPALLMAATRTSPE